MKFTETFANILLLLAIIGTTAGIFIYENSLEANRECITIHYRTYEHGNPTPNVVHIPNNEKTCFRLTSDDTTHMFNLPDFGIYSEAIHPGKWTYVEFTPEEAGEFSFVCTIVCSPLHSKVRGKIIVDG